MQKLLALLRLLEQPVCRKHSKTSLKQMFLLEISGMSLGRRAERNLPCETEVRVYRAIRNLFDALPQEVRDEIYRIRDM